MFCRIIVFLALISTAHAHEGHHHGSEPKQPVQAEPSANEELKRRFSFINESYKKDVKAVFQRSCFNCHSQQPRLPWYHVLPLVRGLIDKDIEESKEHLDFTNDFPFTSHASPKEDLEAIRDSVSDGSMPPLRYRILHWDTRLSPEEKAAVQKWTSESLGALVKEDK